MVPGWTEREMRIAAWGRRDLVADLDRNRRTQAATGPRCTVGVASWRSVFQRGIGVLVAHVLGISGLGAAHDARPDRKKKKHKKKPDRCHTLRRSSGWKTCGNGCCLRGRQVCCADPFTASGKSCHPRDTVCCPKDFGGGGTCSQDEECCPPPRGGRFRTCARPAVGDHCCPVNSGGFCTATRGCCPSDLTNAENGGCCQGACCNDDADCTAQPGDPDFSCSNGCCTEA